MQSLSKNQAFPVVKEQIDLWNPFNLLRGAPNNEFDAESQHITDILLDCNEELTVDFIVRTIEDVFSTWMGPLAVPSGAESHAEQILSKLNKI